MAKRAPGDAGALETEDGGAVAAELVGMLESELVRFTHRVAHDHAIALDRARASMVLLGALVAAGCPWTAQPDSAPARIHDAFAELAARSAADWPPAAAIRGEVARFLEQTSEVAVVDAPARTPAALLRRAGADPDLWWWAAAHDSIERSWVECGSNVARMVQVALAAGTTASRVARALAGALAQGVGKSQTRRTQARDDLALLLTKLAAGGAAVLTAEPALVGTVTKLAFEMAAAQQAWARTRTAPDGLADLALLSFQVVELFQALDRPPHGADLERYADLAARADRVLGSRGLRLHALLRRDLEAWVTGTAGAG
ncbi:MAG: hypothetical protein KF773_40760 [Deltaproteobacteria bacterium]|nr:hypothetical protein [Deltaproteobacteria bacterium]